LNIDNAGGIEMRDNLLREIKKLTKPQGYLTAGLPNFDRLFGRDSCIAAYQLLDFDPEIARATLEILAKYQGKKLNIKAEEEPGKIPHEHYVGGWLDKLKDLIKSQRKPDKLKYLLRWRFPYYGSIDSTAWWLILLSKYLKKTSNEKLKQKLQPNLEMAFFWIENYGDLDKDGFIEYQRKNSYGLLHQSWKDGLEISILPPIAMVEVQGYYYLAYQEFGFKERAENLKKKFNKEFWMPEQNYFALALNGKKEQVKIITSNPGHLLFTGIIEDDKIEKVVKRLFEEDMWTPYGIRTQSANEPNFDPESYHQGSIWPHDNWIIYIGLRKYGYYKEAAKIKEALVSTYRALGHIPELYGVRNEKIFFIKNTCYLQAWASGALLNILK